MESHLVNKLVELRHTVCAYDILAPQVRGGKSPICLNKQTECIFADARDKTKLAVALCYFNIYGTRQVRKYGLQIRDRQGKSS
ncbi:MAG: hypothetical protein ACE5GG_01695 [Candidatus Omnitrophota bacterium]